MATALNPEELLKSGGRHNLTGKLNCGGIVMIPVRYLTAMGLTLLLAVPVAAQPAKSPSSPPAAAPNPTEKETGKSEPANGLIDINSASADELHKLPGVGQVRAQAIISHRPYHGKDDLTNRKIIPENVYNEIKDKIIARQGPTK